MGNAGRKGWGESPLGIPVLYSMAILRRGVRELAGREPGPNLLHTVCGPSQYLYTEAAAKRQAAGELGRREGPAPAGVSVEGGGC